MVQYRTQVNFSLLHDLFLTFFGYIGQSFHPIFDRSTIIPAAKLLWQHMAERGNVHCAICLLRIAGGGGAVDEPDLLSISHLLSLTQVGIP